MNYMCIHGKLKFFFVVKLILWILLKNPFDFFGFAQQKKIFKFGRQNILKDQYPRAPAQNYISLLYILNAIVCARILLKNNNNLSFPKSLLEIISFIFYLRKNLRWRCFRQWRIHNPSGADRRTIRIRESLSFCLLGQGQIRWEGGHFGQTRLPLAK